VGGWCTARAALRLGGQRKEPEEVQCRSAPASPRLTSPAPLAGTLRPAAALLQQAGLQATAGVGAAAAAADVVSTAAAAAAAADDDDVVVVVADVVVVVVVVVRVVDDEEVEGVEQSLKKVG